MGVDASGTGVTGTGSTGACATGAGGPGGTGTGSVGSADAPGADKSIIAAAPSAAGHAVLLLVKRAISLLLPREHNCYRWGVRSERKHVSVPGFSNPAPVRRSAVYQYV